MDTTTAIAQLIELSLSETNALTWLSALSSSHSDREIATSKISLPRMSGHTTAAIRVLSKHPTAIMIVDRREKSEAISLGSSSKGIITMEELRDGTACHAIRSMIALQGKPNVVIIDDVIHNSTDRTMVFDLLNPTCLVLLGSRSCR